MPTYASTVDRTNPQRGQPFSSAQIRGLFDQAGDDIDRIWTVLDDARRPEDYGAIGDGLSHPARVALQVTTLAELRAHDGGVFSFADSIENDMDWLAVQAIFYKGGKIQGRPGAVYNINKTLTLPCGRINLDFSGSKLSGKNFQVQTTSVNLLANASFDLGATGWTQGTLTPRTNVVFSGGKASFTEPTADGVNSYGDFGQQVTLPIGRWTIRLLIKMSFGVSGGVQGAPYINIGFRPDGIGLGAYNWPHPLSFGSLQARKIPFEGWVSFDVEVLEPTTAWLDIQGGNCNWEVQEASISPFLMNYMIFATGDPVPQATGTLLDVSSWVGGELLGPLTGNFESGLTGPAVGGILHKNFQGEGARCNFERLFMYAWDVGISLSSQTFLNVFHNVNIGGSRTCVKFLDASVNAGENFRFSSCILFNSELAIHAAGGGEWNFWGCSFDYCKRLILLEKAAKVSMLGHHLEFTGSETRLAAITPAGALATNEILTGGTSGATARLLINRIGDYGHVVIDVLTGTFVSGETVSGTAGSFVASGVVAFGPPLIDLRGGSLLDYSGEILQAGGAHRGAQHMINLESLADTMVCHDWWGYGLNTASGTLVTGSGRFTSHRLLGPGNQFNPPMFQRTHNTDVFAGNGRLIGAGTAADMGFQGPADGIGLIYAAHSSSSTPPTSRGLIPAETEISLDTGVFRVAGHGSLKLQMIAGFAGGGEARIYIPVTPNDIVLDEYYYSKPTVVAPIAHGPYVTAAFPNQILVSTTGGSSIATVYDNQAAASYAYGPQPGWTVTFTNITGNPGGIANAVWNATHTIVKRNQASGVEYTINLGAGNIASSTSGLVGGGTVTSTYNQTNVLVFDRRMWVQVGYNDAVGRPVINNASFQGESTITLPFAATGWVRRNFVSHYQEPIVITGDLTADRYNNGRAPHWATHYMIVLNYGDLRIMNPAAPPALHLTDFIGNRL